MKCATYYTIVNRAELASGDAGIEVRLELFDGRKMELIYSRNYWT